MKTITVVLSEEEFITVFNMLNEALSQINDSKEIQEEIEKDPQVLAGIGTISKTRHAFEVLARQNGL